MACVTLELVVRFKAWQINSPASITLNRSTPCIKEQQRQFATRAQGGAIPKETHLDVSVAESFSLGVKRRGSRVWIKMCEKL